MIFYHISEIFLVLEIFLNIFDFPSFLTKLTATYI